MNDENKQNDKKEILVEDFGAGLVKLIAEGAAVIFGPNAGNGSNLVQTVRGEIAGAFRKMEAGIADIVGRNDGQGKSDTRQQAKEDQPKE